MASLVSVTSDFGHMLPAEHLSYGSVGKRSTSRGLMFGVSGYRHPLLVTSVNEQGCVIHFEHENGPELRDVGLNNGFAGPLATSIAFRVDPSSAYVYGERSPQIGALLLGPEQTVHLVTRYKRGIFEDTYDAPLTDQIAIDERAIGYLRWEVGVMVDRRFVDFMRVSAAR